MKWISRSVQIVVACVDSTLFVSLLLMLKRTRTASVSGGTGITTMTAASTSRPGRWSVIARPDRCGRYELSWSGTPDDRARVRVVAPTN